jgi:hypothetical protein
MWVTCPRSASSGDHAEFHEGCYQKHTEPLNCRTISSDISGYHTDFHEGHGTVGEWQGRGMACVHYCGTAGARHGMRKLMRNGRGAACHACIIAERQGLGMACVN